MFTEIVELNEAINLPDLVFRGYKGEEDLPALLTVINESKAADGVEEVETLEGLRNIYTHLSHCDPARDVIVAEEKGEVVGFGRLRWAQMHAGGRSYVHFWFVRPAWRGQGLEEAMLRWLEGRAREIAAGHPKDGPRWLDTLSIEQETAKCAILESAGYEIARLFYEMVRPDLENIPDLPLPQGLEVRPVQPDQLREIWDGFTEAFADHWGEEVQTEAAFERFHGSVEYAPDIWKVAWDMETNEVAGGVLGFIDEALNEAKGLKRGWTENIAVRRKWRRRGLARALMAENMRELKRRGMTEAALGVDTENRTGALNLYLSMGFRPVMTMRVYRKQLGR